MITLLGMTTSWPACEPKASAGATKEAETAREITILSRRGWDMAVSFSPVLGEQITSIDTIYVENRKRSPQRSKSGWQQPRYFPNLTRPPSQDASQQTRMESLYPCELANSREHEPVRVGFPVHDSLVKKRVRNNPVRTLPLPFSDH